MSPDLVAHNNNNYYNTNRIYTVPYGRKLQRRWRHVGSVFSERLSELN